MGDVKTDNIMLQNEGLLEILGKISYKSWEETVKREPEWRNMENLLPKFGFGPFSVLMVTTGLNDYQLKGKAEIAYWPKIKHILENSTVPKSIEEMYSILESFYMNERLNKQKIARLRKIFNSQIAKFLWNSSPKEVSQNFIRIWREISWVMGQKRDAKTIVFAMKCLGIALLMVGEYGFDFKPIPVPVDSRVASFTKKLDSKISTDEETRKYWTDVLIELNKNNPKVTMIHLDSLIWQISPLDSYEFKRYFAILGETEVGEKLCKLLDL